MRSVLAAISLSLCLALPAPAEEMPGTHFTSGAWGGAAETDDTGAFAYCYATVSYTSGEQLWVSLAPDDSVTLYIAAPPATFVPDRSYAASLMTEIGFPLTGEAFATDAATISFRLNGLDGALDFLTQGVHLRLLGVGADLSFDIRGLGGALAQARVCLDRQSDAPVAEASPPSSPALGVGAGGTRPIQMDRSKVRRPPARSF